MSWPRRRVACGPPAHVGLEGGTWVANGCTRNALGGFESSLGGGAPTRMKMGGSGSFGVLTTRRTRKVLTICSFTRTLETNPISEPLPSSEPQARRRHASGNAGDAARQVLPRFAAVPRQHGGPAAAAAGRCAHAGGRRGLRGQKGGTLQLGPEAMNN